MESLAAKLGSDDDEFLSGLLRFLPVGFECGLDDVHASAKVNRHLSGDSMQQPRCLILRQQYYV